MLYYGCRHEREDYLYRQELAQFQQEGVLTQLNVAFSRDQAEKVLLLPAHRGAEGGNKAGNTQPAARERPWQSREAPARLGELWAL